MRLSREPADVIAARAGDGRPGRPAHPEDDGPQRADSLWAQGRRARLWPDALCRRLLRGAAAAHGPGTGRAVRGVLSGGARPGRPVRAPAIHRVIPVEEAVPAGIEVYPYERATELLENAKAWGVRDCICRVQQKLVGKGCDRPVENCLVFAPVEGVFDGSEITRPITKAGGVAYPARGGGRRAGPLAGQLSGRQPLHMKLLHLLLRRAPQRGRVQHPDGHRPAPILCSWWTPTCAPAAATAWRAASSTRWPCRMTCAW